MYKNTKVPIERDVPLFCSVRVNEGPKIQSNIRRLNGSNICGLIGVCSPIELRPVNRKRLKVVSIEPNVRHIGKVQSIMLKRLWSEPRAINATRGFRSRTRNAGYNPALKFHKSRGYALLVGNFKKAPRLDKPLWRSTSGLVAIICASSKINWEEWELLLMLYIWCTKSQQQFLSFSLSRFSCANINQISQTRVSSAMRYGRIPISSQCEHFANNARCEISLGFIRNTIE